ncbi:putative phage head-tail adaptor [Vitreoscilla sp. C1]|uniref:head-tail connector protein n=1 Tax=Vitreoscilla sp. (strain C1) TaxID=96942 RepID=UPI000CDC66CF|nr:head-tail connector protein [Vitreoscilla sp. C1]AUZ06352.1 putative phage head-tail adaptor [Vitreoscilla sp. C1]
MITAEQVKSQCRIDFDDEDGYLPLLVNAAISACLAYLNRPVFESEADLLAAISANPELDQSAMVVTHDIRMAMLITAAFLYENREGNTNLPLAATSLLRQHRKRPGV